MRVTICLVIKEPNSRIPQITPSVQRSPFPTRQTRPNLPSRLFQTLPTPLPPNRPPTLRQPEYPVPALPAHGVPPTRDRHLRQVPDHLPHPPRKPGHHRRVPHRAITVHRVRRRVDRLVVERVVVVPQEAPVEEEAASDVRQAAGETGAGGRVALEAVVVDEVVVALGQRVHVERVVGEGVGGEAGAGGGDHALREDFHLGDEERDDGRVWWWMELAAD